MPRVRRDVILLASCGRAGRLGSGALCIRYDTGNRPTSNWGPRARRFQLRHAATSKICCGEPRARKRSRGSTCGPDATPGKSDSLLTSRDILLKSRSTPQAPPHCVTRRLPATKNHIELLRGDFARPCDRQQCLLSKVARHPPEALKRRIAEDILGFCATRTWHASSSRNELQLLNQLCGRGSPWRICSFDSPSSRRRGKGKGERAVGSRASLGNALGIPRECCNAP
jgi:hypothetical protein